MWPISKDGIGNAPWDVATSSDNCTDTFTLNVERKDARLLANSVTLGPVLEKWNFSVDIVQAAVQYSAFRGHTQTLLPPTELKLKGRSPNPCIILAMN